MFRDWLLCLTAGLALLLPVSGSGAAEAVDRYKAGPLIGFSAGMFDIVQGDDEAFEGRLEYRHNNDWWFKPLLNVTGTTDGTAFISAGFYSELFLTDEFYLSPSFTPGVFLRGQGKNLGHPIEFRSQIEIGWRFYTGMRASISLNHLSNAGSGRRNPGSESVVFSLLIPFDKLFE
jgi:lipid A 3-O-deacylase